MGTELAGFGARAAPGPEEGQAGGELDHAGVDVVGHEHVPGRVEGHAVGVAELARPATVFAGFAVPGPFRGEPLDAVVVVVGDHHLGFVAASPRGSANWPGALPPLPHCSASPPSRLKRSMRLFSESATNTWLPATAIPPPGGSVGFWEEPKWNSPRPVPLLPQAPMKAPLGSNFSIRLWLESTTYTLPAGSTASAPIGAELAGAGP